MLHMREKSDKVQLINILNLLDKVKEEKRDHESQKIWEREKQSNDDISVYS